MFVWKRKKAEIFVWWFTRTQFVQLSKKIQILYLYQTISREKLQILNVIVSDDVYLDKKSFYQKISRDVSSFIQHITLLNIAAHVYFSESKWGYSSFEQIIIKLFWRWSWTCITNNSTIQWIFQYYHVYCDRL